MKRWLIREYHDDDLESVVRLCDTTSNSQHSVFTPADYIGVLRSLGKLRRSVTQELLDDFGHAITSYGRV
ncbi:hypothetical protein GCM10009745_10120 [Kribbella yunnanensis]|uniref:GNAT family N-acetyltransferase n=1 Tax=Kribbella yunnanensis TaxID=190194 RepID=A0ABP4SCC7_9ACTN